MGDKLYVKWKGYDNFFNSWVFKKGIVIQNWVIFRNHIPILKTK